MYKVSCSSCGQLVEIAPESALCSTCGKDLIDLLPAEGTPQHYYERAEKKVDQNDLDSALQIVQDGLENVVSSDLLLLGAILAEKDGQYDLMRHYVSRIPVDDSLRGEGEWLLRAHQARQRAQRQGRDPSQAVLEEMSDTFGLPPTADYDDLAEDEWHDPPTSDVKTLRRRMAPIGLSLLVLIGLSGVGWFYSEQLLSQSWVPTTLRSEPSDTDSLQDVVQEVPAQNNTTDLESGAEPEVADDNPLGTGTNSESGNPGLPVNAPPAQPTEADNSGDLSSTPTVVPTPTISADVLLKQYQPPPATENDGIAPSSTEPEQVAPNEIKPDESIPDDLTENTTPEPVADADPQTVVDVLAQEPFDVLKHLRDVGRPDLAGLPLDAQVQDGKLIVTGVVRWYEERESIIGALQLAPGVDDVNAIGLKIRTPETYTIQEADTLWIIAYRIYGDGARWPQIYEFNQDILRSPDTLGLGQILKVPPQ